MQTTRSVEVSLWADLPPQSHLRNVSTIRRQPFNLRQDPRPPMSRQRVWISNVVCRHRNSHWWRTSHRILFIVMLMEALWLNRLCVATSCRLVTYIRRCKRRLKIIVVKDKFLLRRHSQAHLVGISPMMAPRTKQAFLRD